MENKTKRKEYAFINLNEKFISKELNEKGSYKVTIPKGTVIDGIDISYKTFYTKFINDNSKFPSLKSLPFPADFDISLYPHKGEKDIMKVKASVLSDAVKAGYISYKEKAKVNEVDKNKKLFLAIKDSVQNLMDDKYEEFVKAMVSIELDINDEKILDEIYSSYMNNDNVYLIDKEFLELSNNIVKNSLELDTLIDEVEKGNKNLDNIVDKELDIDKELKDDEELSI